MTSRALVVAAGALGCASRVELPDVPIVGGTPEARRAAQAELERLDAWVGAGRLRVREVRFEDLEEPTVGEWKEGRGLVRVGTEVPVHDVADVVRHELCHALDGAEDLSERSASFARLGSGLAYLHDEQREAPEAFAQVCEKGPLAAAVVSSVSCRDDDPDLASAFDFLADEVWTGDVSLDPATPGGERLGGFDLDLVFEPVASWGIDPTIDPDRLAIRLALVEFGLAEVEVDFATGEMLPNEHLERLSASVDPPPGLSYGAPFVLVAMGWPDGHGAAVVTYLVLNQPLLTPRVVVHDGEQWRPVADTCAGEDGIFFGLFTARDHAWYAWDDGEAIYWAPLSGE